MKYSLLNKHRLTFSAMIIRLLFKVPAMLVVATLFVGCTSGQIRSQVEANVKSEVIEIPPQAALDFKAAIGLLNNEKIEKASDAFKKMIELYPQLAGPYANLGVIYSRQSKWSEAKDTLIEGSLRNPKNVKILNQLGLVYRHTGDFINAEKSYVTAIKTAPSSSAAYLNLGILYDIYMGKFTKASGYYQKYQSMQIKPDRKVAGWIVDINRRAGLKTQIASEEG